MGKRVAYHLVLCHWDNFLLPQAVLISSIKLILSSRHLTEKLPLMQSKRTYTLYETFFLFLIVYYQACKYTWVYLVSFEIFKTVYKFRKKQSTTILHDLQKGTISSVRQQFNIWKFRVDLQVTCRTSLQANYRQENATIIAVDIYGKKSWCKIRKIKQPMIGTDLLQFGTFLA